MIFESQNLEFNFFNDNSFNILVRQNPEFMILERLKSIFTILDDFKMMVGQNPDLKLFERQHPDFMILADF